uniref:Uncharacterized protein n=1 Tax=Anguilla anguilla TaxID=7936 RepID=A0A0E9W1P0_ANGAN
MAKLFLEGYQDGRFPSVSIACEGRPFRNTLIREHKQMTPLPSRPCSFSAAN